MAVTKQQIMAVFERFITERDELDAILSGEAILTSTTADSLAMVHLVTELEKEFNTRFELETLEQVFENIDSLESYLASNSQ